jgi:hypothetical protein
MSITIAGFLSLGSLAGALILFSVVWLWRRRERAEGRRNPLTQNLLRSPGQSLRGQLDELRWDVAMYLSIGMLPIPLAMGVLLSHWVSQGKPPGAVLIALVAMCAAGALAWLGWKLWTALRVIRRLRLGYGAELAVGQELNELLRHGYRVFHDFPVEEHKFNIDHVVVGPGGVFAIETKGRSKPASRNGGGAHWEVSYDGRGLQFPGWHETNPIRQAESAARWLRKWLSSAVGEEVRVDPLLVLPGWYIKRTSPDGIPVLAMRQVGSYVSARKAALTEQLVQRIAHQLEQKCRDVAPAAYQAPDEQKA